ncbi:MAG: hypothetical protein KQH79_05110 [Bacteroidetes bacterium]|nr:hypothetical protein [Bacteroidota bacterium]
MKSNEKNMLIAPSKKKGEKKVKITFKNDLTIFSIESIKDQFINAVQKNDVIQLELKDVKNIDLTFMQLIYSLKISSASLKKEVSVNANLSEDIKSLFSNSGISKILK